MFDPVACESKGRHATVYGIYSSQKKNKVCIYKKKSVYNYNFGMLYCFLALTATKLVRLWINCKIWNVFSLSRLENKIVGGFRVFNIVKMLLFTTTFCRSTHLMIMKMMSKRDVTIILVFKSENNY